MAQYGEGTKSALDTLAASLDDESFYQTVLKEFQFLSDRLYSLIAELNEYKEQETKLQPNDPTRESLNSLIKATKAQYRKILDQKVIEYMTNAGLLPNYAFPETGVKLEASVFSSREKEDNTNNMTAPVSLELVRAASQGIKELAPGNSFYTQKFKLEVSGIPTFDWKDHLVNMRYCSKCDCLAEKGTTEYSMASCPKCGDPSWGVNTHQYLLFTGARSATFRTDAALDDSNEDRVRELFLIKKHFMFHHKKAVSSYVMKNIGFGIEFCDDLDLYEANYGLQMQSGSKIEVNNDTTIPEYGFATCKYCGKSTPQLTRLTKDHKQVEQHYRFCRHKDINFADDHSGEVFERLFLYRHMTTEAIKILLPIQIMDATAVVEMFKAGIVLGMKEYYHSSPEHIRIDSYTEANHASGQKDYYLVMYDTIPGGTGYLAKLYNTEEFTQLLKYAYEKIQYCTCQLEGKDGCYHCILSYGNQYSRDSFSRERAEELFAKLVDSAMSWERINGSIGTIASEGAAEDSELELKFIRAMQTHAEKVGWTLEKVPDDNEYHYELRIIDEECDTVLDYYIKPQFELTVAYGVRHTTIPDFLFMCTYAKVRGVEYSELTRIPWWAVYLDGYKYHAQALNMRFYGDLEKREGIRQAKPQRMFSWTITWEDIQLFEEEKEDELGLNSVSRLAQLLARALPGCIKEDCFCCINDAEAFLSHGGSLYSGILDINPYCDQDLTYDSTDEEVETAFDAGLKYDLKIYQGISIADKNDWVGFWRRYNLLQVFSNSHHEEDSSGDSSTINRDEIKQYYPGMEEIVDALIDNNIPFSHDGIVELIDDDNAVIASAGLIIDNPKIAIDPMDSSSRVAFEQQGYRTMTANEFNVESIK